MAQGNTDSLKCLKKRQKPLRFNDNGKFRILHLTDIHMVDEEMDDDEDKNIPKMKSEKTMNVIEECIKRTNPDLVVFGGDNISGYWEEYTYDYMVKTIRRITKPITDRNIPLIIVFGNHDSEGEEIREFLRREIQICIYSEYENFRTTMNDEDVTGCGNCCYEILSSDGSKTSWAIWGIDSGDYIRDENHRMVDGEGYAYVHDDQIEWYERKSAELKEKNNGVNVPSILFQHIPVRQELDFVMQAEDGAEFDFKCGENGYIIDDDILLCGEANEMPCPTKDNRKQFESWLKTGNMVNAFFGHDHVNDFTMKIDGIRLTQTIGAGYHTYGKARGGRIIVLDEKTGTLETESVVIYK